MLDIDHKELEDASLSPEGSEEGSLDVALSPLCVGSYFADFFVASCTCSTASFCNISPSYPVFQALPVLAHRVFHGIQEAKAELASGHHAAHELVEIPLLGFSVQNLMDYLMKNDYATKCVLAHPHLHRCLTLHISYYFLPGSLTTPPCTEGVHWIISAKHMTIPGTEYALSPSDIYIPRERVWLVPSARDAVLSPCATRLSPTSLQNHFTPHSPFARTQVPP